MYSQELTPKRLLKLAEQARKKSYKCKNRDMRYHLQGYAMACEDLARNLKESISAHAQNETEKVSHKT